MNRLGLILRQKIFIIIVVIMVVMGGIVIYWYISRDDSKYADNYHVEKILVAGCDIDAGAEITEDMLEYRDIPKNIYSEKFIVSKEEILGKKTDTYISEGEIIFIENLEENLADEENYLKFSSYIPSGLRAVSIPVNYYGDASLISCGDRVDVVSTFYDRESDLLVSETVLSGKEIVLIEGRKTTEMENYGLEDTGSSGEISVLGEMFGESFAAKNDPGLLVITLYLKPEETERIFLAIESGVLDISICPGTGVTGF